jgi:hypothetical protein
MGCLVITLTTLAACVRGGWTPIDGSSRDAAPKDAPSGDQPQLPEARPLDRLVCETSGIVVPPTCTCESTDFDGDGHVNVSDLARLATCWGKPAVGTCTRCDTNSDGLVDCKDLACLSQSFLKCTP